MQPLEQLRVNIEQCFLGHREAVDRVLVCLLAQGHVLIEDVPGVGKTILASALARSLDCRFSRIQLTPDLLPADVLGVTVWDQRQAQFIFKPGPIFANVILADEINRATPRTQSALLEAMNESQVSIDGQTRPLEPPFFVIATQNPYEFEGTYFLPESQLDRFLMRIALGYPDATDEARILTIDPLRTQLHQLEPVMSAEQLTQLQRQVGDVKVDPALVEYVVALARATREHDRLQIGVSPRGALALVRAAAAAALLAGRDYVVPDDLVELIQPVWTHRLLSRDASPDADGRAAELVLRDVIESVDSPM